MDQEIRNKLHNVVLESRAMLEQAVANRLEGRFSIFERAGKLVADPNATLAHLDDDERSLRLAVLAHLHELERQGTPKLDAFRALRREVAFTWLNRFVAFKMLEARKLIRETLARWEDSNGYKHWLAVNDAALADHDRGGEHRERAYHQFLLARCGELDREIHVLFDPANLPSRLAPPPRDLKQLAGLLNDPDLADAWKPGNEEALGWVYQDFNESDLEPLRGLSSFKIPPELIPAKTQKFTLQWVVKYLIDNTLGQLWFEVHPDSTLSSHCSYRVSLPEGHRTKVHVPRSVKDLRLLDPACGTMHFGLVAFDLFVAMYREEMANVGKLGWPEKPPVAHADDIPAAILEHNLHGIDIDLRAVQISALALYLKAKALAPKKPLGESRLACANIHMLNGDRLGLFLKEAKLDNRPIYRRILQALQEELKQSEHLGSLLPLEKRIKALVEAERKQYEKEGRQPDLFGWSAEQFESEAGQQEFWSILEIQIGQALDAFARDQAEMGVNQAFFAGETVKGLRLLELLTQTYDVVVMNPPFLDTRDMNDQLKKLIDMTYSDSKRNLYAPFVIRGLALLQKNGLFGAITGQTFMFIKTFENFRNSVAEQCVVDSLLQFDYGLFPGVRVDTAAFVLRRCEDADERAKAVATYFRLVKEPDAQSKRRRYERALTNLDADPVVYRYSQADFAAIPGNPWVYWITPGLRKLFETLPKLGDVAQPRQGLATADNFRFLRYWWEVGTPQIAFGCTDATAALATKKRWFPYMKGGSFQRWYGNQEYVVNWENDGAEIKNGICERYPYLNGKWEWVAKNTDYYFRRGVTVPKITCGRFSARISQEGFIFADATSGLFPDYVMSALAVLNSSVFQYLLWLINPTVNSQVGDLARLPIPQHSSPSLEVLVEQAIELAKQDSREDETTWDFIAPPSWPDGMDHVSARHAQLAELERQIDEEVYRLYDISDNDRQAIERELAESQPISDADENETPADAEESSDEARNLTRDKLAHQWLSYAVGIVLGQFQPGNPNGLGRGAFDTTIGERLLEIRDEDGLIPVDTEHPQDMAGQVWSALEIMLGDAAAAEIVRATLGSGSPQDLLRGFLADKYFQNHTQQYRKRPIYWLLQSSKKNYALWLYYQRLDKDLLFKALVNYVEPKIRLETSRLESLRSQKAAAGESGREAKRIAKDMERQEDFLSELRDFEDKLRRAANLHLEPDLNDGVVLNIAPLWELVPWREAKRYWDELLAGKYEWSSIGKQLRQKGLVKD